MIDYKTISNWVGYENRDEITNMPVNALAPGSQNVFIEESKKIVPSGSYSLLGAAKTVNIGIRSSYDNFVNVQGVNLPIRETPNNGAKGDVLEVWYNGAWEQITPDINTKPLGKHVYSFAEWYDDIEKKAKLIWVNGNSGNDAINSWNGARAVISAVTSNTISIASGTWQELGFDATGSLVINGSVYSYTGGYTTNTLTGVTPDPAAAGITAGDVAWDLYVTQSGYQSGAAYDAGFNFDICSMLYNQVYYADWTRRNFFPSFAFNRAAYFSNTSYAGTSGLNDITFAGSYTGVKNSIFEVTIDTVAPDINIQEFSATGPFGLNNGVYVTTGYSGAAGVTNNYKVLVVAEMTLALVTASISGSYNVGETVIGSGSQAIGLIVAILPSIQPGIDALAIDLVSGSFDIADTITGQSSGATATLATNGISGQDWIQYYKNDVLTTITSAGVTGKIVPISNTLTTTLTDGLTITWGNYFGHAVGDAFKLKIRTGGADTFAWSIDGTQQATNVPITTLAQTLGQGVTAQFNKKNGHNTGDKWTVTAFYKVVDGYREFTFSVPIRRPGESADLLVDRPVKAFRPQEDKMEIFCFGGLMYETNFQLAADLSGESLTIKKFKSEAQNEPISNELVTNIKNSVVYLNKDYEIDELGRVEQITTQQTRTISDRIKNDLEGKNYTDGHCKFFNNFFILSVPKELKQYYYDFMNGYWQAPQTVPGGRIAVIDGSLVMHSYNTNESYKLFDGFSANGHAYVSRIVTPFNSYDERFHKKRSTKIFIEGYKNTPTVLDIQAEFDYGGCSGIFTDKINPLFCVPRDNASLGKTGLGKKGLGTNLPSNLPKFHVFVPHNVETQWYEQSIAIECSTLEQQYAIISIGSDVEQSDKNNSQNTSTS